MTENDATMTQHQSTHSKMNQNNNLESIIVNAYLYFDETFWFLINPECKFEIKSYFHFEKETRLNFQITILNR